MGQNRPRHEAGDFELLPGGLAGVRRGAVTDLLFGAFLALILVRAAHSRARAGSSRLADLLAGLEAV